MGGSRVLRRSRPNCRVSGVRPRHHRTETERGRAPEIPAGTPVFDGQAHCRPGRYQQAPGPRIARRVQPEAGGPGHGDWRSRTKGSRVSGSAPPAAAPDGGADWRPGQGHPSDVAAASPRYPRRPGAGRGPEQRMPGVRRAAWHPGRIYAPGGAGTSRRRRAVPLPRGPGEFAQHRQTRPGQRSSRGPHRRRR